MTDIDLQRAALRFLTGSDLPTCDDGDTLMTLGWGIGYCVDDEGVVEHIDSSVWIGHLLDRLKAIGLCVSFNTDPWGNSRVSILAQFDPDILRQRVLGFAEGLGWGSRALLTALDSAGLLSSTEASS